MKDKIERQKAIAVNRMREFIRLQGKAISTERSYCRQIARYVGFITSRNWPEGASSESKLEAFLNAEAKRDVASSTQNGAFHAICYYYRHVLKRPLQNVNALRSKRGEHVREAPTKEETRRVLMAVADTPLYPARLICHLIYACGLRIGETTAIRLKDIQLDELKLTIRGGKGKKDRVVNIPECLAPQLQLQIEAAEAIHKKARLMGVPAKLPNKLATKYPKAPYQRRWFWLFPQAQPCIDPRTKARVWWHCLEDVVQGAMRRANDAAGTEGIGPHHLRHAWATHAFDDGASLRDLQEILGHKDIETTARYVRPQPERVPSPIINLNLAKAQ